MEIRGQAFKARGSGLAASVFMTLICIFNMFPGEVDAAFAHISTANYRRVWLLSHFYTASRSEAVSGAAVSGKLVKAGITHLPSFFSLQPSKPHLVC